MMARTEGFATGGLERRGRGCSWSGWKLIADGFAVVSNQEKASGEDRVVPGFAAEGVQFGEFGEAVGLGGAEVNGTVFVLDDDPIACEQRLAGSESTVFPQAISGGDVEAGESAVIEAVEVAIQEGGAVELGFHLHAGPDFGDTELAVG
jgi:hypothetical protein